MQVGYSLDTSDKVVAGQNQDFCKRWPHSRCLKRLPAAVGNSDVKRCTLHVSTSAQHSVAVHNKACFEGSDAEHHINMIEGWLKQSVHC
jgi:hypothetical protein